MKCLICPKRKIKAAVIIAWTLIAVGGLIDKPAGAQSVDDFPDSAGGFASPSSDKPGEYQCSIELIDEPTLASSEGGLVSQILSEGTEVKDGMVVAATDDEDALLMRASAWYQWQSTVKNVESDIRERYSAAQAEVDKAAYQMVVDANKKAEKAISLAELEQRKWKWKASQLAIDNEAHERSVLKITAMKEEADFKRAEAAVYRHRIKSPINGIVVARLKKVGEYVRPGDDVVRVARLDKLKAKGVLRTSEILPHEAKGRRVSIAIDLGGQTKDFEGQISFVDPEVMSADETYFVWVEFDNSSNYAIRPGMHGTMRINP